MMRNALRAAMFVLLIMALATWTVAQGGAVSGCKSCPNCLVVETETEYEDTPLDLSNWGCDVCCIDATTPDGFLDNARMILAANGSCGTTVNVNKVSDCATAVSNAAMAAGDDVSVCIVGHGAPGVVSQGAGPNANNGQMGGDRDDLDSESKPAFTDEVEGDVSEIHIFSCSTGADQEFVNMLATDTGAHVEAPDMKICADDEDFYHEEGGEMVTVWPHKVTDTVSSTTPTNWSEGIWTKDGEAIPDCVTFDGGISVQGTATDMEWCIDWPNDWHWSMSFTWGETYYFIDAWFEFEVGDSVGLEVYKPVVTPGDNDGVEDIVELVYMVNTIEDTITISDKNDGQVLHFGPFSAYPHDLGPQWEASGIQRAIGVLPAPVVFAQFGSGGVGDLKLASEITLYTLDAPAADAIVRFNDQQGRPMTVSINGQEVQGQMKVQVPADGALRLRADSQGPLRLGSVIVNSERRISGLILYGGEGLGMEGLAPSPKLRAFRAPVRYGDGMHSGVALSSLGGDQTVQLQLRNEEGQIVARSQAELPANGQLALLVHEFEWDAEVDFTTFSGTLTGDGTTDFAATLILQGPGEMAALPVTRMR